MKLINGDCLEEMKKIKDGSIDMILCDPPYGTTEIKWDNVINFKELWVEYERIIKDNGVIILFAQQPFTSFLVCSNSKLFRHNIVWHKSTCANFLAAKYCPRKITEDILIFSKGNFPHNSKNKCTYNPQKETRDTYVPPINWDKKQSDGLKAFKPGRKPMKKLNTSKDHDPTKKLPGNLIYYAHERTKQHPTQKPVALLEYLIKTYSNENEVVLDNTMGSGSTGVAALNTKRDFIGIELDKNYFEIAQQRIKEAQHDNL